MTHNPIPNRDGEWQFDGDDWFPRAEADKPLVQRQPLARRAVPTWVLALALAMILICIAVPPLATALFKGLA